MAWQFDTAVRNGRLDAIETVTGTSAVIKIFDGALPANCAAADNGTVLATFNLPSDWMNAAASGVKTKLGTWEDSTADGTGTADYARLYSSDGTTCRGQCTVTATGGGGDITLNNINIATGQTVTITAFQWTEGSA